jgi:hypothetical protein
MICWSPGIQGLGQSVVASVQVLLGLDQGVLVSARVSLGDPAAWVLGHGLGWNGVSGGGDWGCGGDGGFSVMMVVDGVVSGSGSSWMSIIWVARATERVRGMVDEMGWGFRTLLGEIPILVSWPLAL